MGTVQRQIPAGVRAFDIAQAGPCGHALNGRDKVDDVSRMDDLRKLSILLVDEQGSGLGGRTVEYFPPPIDGHGYIGAGTADDIAEMVTVHHQKVQSRKASGPEQFRGTSVQHDAEAVVDHIQAGGYDDAKGGGVFRIVQFIFIGICIGMKIVAGNCHAGIVHSKGYSKLFL